MLECSLFSATNQTVIGMLIFIVTTGIEGVIEQLRKVRHWLVIVEQEILMSTTVVEIRIFNANIEICIVERNVVREPRIVAINEDEIISIAPKARCSTMSTEAACH